MTALLTAIGWATFGACIGVLVAALCCAAKKADE